MNKIIVTRSYMESFLFDSSDRVSRADVRLSFYLSPNKLEHDSNINLYNILLLEMHREIAYKARRARIVFDEKILNTFCVVDYYFKDNLIAYFDTLEKAMQYCKNEGFKL